MKVIKKHQKKIILLRIGITIFISSRLGVVSYFSYSIYSEIFKENPPVIQTIKKNKQTVLKGESDGIYYRSFDSHFYDIRLFLNDDKGKLISSFENLDNYIQKNITLSTDQGSQVKRLFFAINAGIYHQDMMPVGLHIENGTKISNADVSNGDGSFYIKPNGVFFIDKYGNSDVMETQNFLFFRGNKTDELKLATQSGPLLLQNGKIHQALNPNSPNKSIRSGVGIKNGKVYFVLSKNEVNFYTFALFFKNELGIKDALYLDGAISDVRWESESIFEGKESFVGMIGVLK